MVLALTPEEREIAICFLLCRDGRKCNVCKKRLDLLIEEDEEYREENNLPPRKRPLLVVECIPNTGDHSNFNDLQLACYPCNKRKDLPGPGTTQGYGPTVTREKLDSLRFEPTYHRNLQTLLQDEIHICRKELVIAGKSLSEGANQVTTERYFGDEIITKVNPRGKYQLFPYQCESQFCNGVHVCLVGIKPTKLIQMEKIKLENQWNDLYGGNMDKEEERQWKFRHLSKTWIPLEEFVLQHGLLANHNFI